MVAPLELLAALVAVDGSWPLSPELASAVGDTAVERVVETVALAAPAVDMGLTPVDVVARADESSVVLPSWVMLADSAGRDAVAA